MARGERLVGGDASEAALYVPEQLSDDRRGRDGHDHADEPPHGSEDDQQHDHHRRVDVHGVPLDPRDEQVVLQLLDDDVDEDHGKQEVGRGRQHEDHRGDAAQPRPQDGDEFRDARPQSQADSELHIEQRQRDRDRGPDDHAEQQLPTDVPPEQAVRDARHVRHVVLHRAGDRPHEVPLDEVAVAQGIEEPERHDQEAGDQRDRAGE